MTDFGRRAAVAAANVLPKTGQTTSYRDGDDGYHEAGWEGDRFTDNGDGTITDNATGLMWGDDANGEGGGGGVQVTWAGAIDAAAGITLGGHTDWRLANPREILSLIDSALSLLGYVVLISNMGHKVFWTSTTDAGSTGDAYMIDDRGFRQLPLPKGDPGYALYCRNA